MSDWKKESLKKKNYRRGGIELDPPRKQHKTKKKPFRVEYSMKGNGRLDSLFRKWFSTKPQEWYHHGRYATRKDADHSVKDQIHKNYHSIWRIVDTRTKEIVWKTKPQSDGNIT